MKEQEWERVENSHSSPCHFCMSCLKVDQSVSLVLGQGFESQIPMTSSMKRPYSWIWGAQQGRILFLFMAK